MTTTRSSVTWRRAIRGPVVTLALAAAAILVAALPGLTEAAQLESASLASEPWRLLTCHLSHFSVSHLAYDLGVLLALGWVCESRWPERTRAGLLLALPLCAAVVLLGAPQLNTYRGLSGLDSTLLVFLAARLHVEGAFRSAWTRRLPLITGLGFLAKITYELLSSAAVFADDSLFVPVPLAHLAGGLVGLVAAVWPSTSRRPMSTGSTHRPASCGSTRSLAQRL